MTTKKTLTLIMICLLPILLINSVNAITPVIFSNTGLSGDWLTCDGTTFNINNTHTKRSGYANFTFPDNTNVIGLFNVMEIQNISSYVSDWSLSDYLSFYYAIELTNGSKNYYSLVNVQFTDNSFIGDTTKAYIGIKNQAMIELANFMDFENEIDISFTFNSTENKLYVNYGYTGLSLSGSGSGYVEPKKYVEEFNCDISFFSGNITVNLYTGFNGNCGEFYINMDTIIYNSGDTIPETSGDYEEATNNLNDSWLYKAWEFLNSIWNIIFKLFDIAISLFLTIVDYLPFIAVLYFLDALTRSILTLSFQPIGYVFQITIEFIMYVVNLGLALISAIGELLPF